MAYSHHLVQVLEALSVLPNQLVNDKGRYRWRTAQNRIHTPVYSTGQAARLLGISADNLRWRIKVGRYPEAAKSGDAPPTKFTVMMSDL